MTTRKVEDLSEDKREALETLLGGPLRADQQVFVIAYTSGGKPSQTISADAAEEQHAEHAARDERRVVGFRSDAEMSGSADCAAGGQARTSG